MFSYKTSHFSDIERFIFKWDCSADEYWASFTTFSNQTTVCHADWTSVFYFDDDQWKYECEQHWNYSIDFWETVSVIFKRLSIF